MVTIVALIVSSLAGVALGDRLQSIAAYKLNFSHARWTTQNVNYTTVIHPAKRWGVWEGWGTSLCWWAKAFGQRDDLADLFFTVNFTVFNGTLLPGLGMNIARYNAGATGRRPVSDVTMQTSPNIDPSRQIETFWTDWYSADQYSSSWNWSADANQVAMLLKARDRGADLLDLFSNSPVWWQCSNHNPSGSRNGRKDNLEASSRWRHVGYLATVAQHAAKHWGIEFNSVEPFNEPISEWWKATGTQEGCHFSHDSQSLIVAMQREELDRRNLTAMRVAASDENTYTEALATWSSFSHGTRSLVGQVNVHGYEQADGRRDLLREAVGHKRLWNSEYGDSDATGMSMASNLNLDFRWLHNTAWVYWQVLDAGGWGLIDSDLTSGGWIGGATVKYFVLAHYSRHIRPGMTILDGGESNTVAAYDSSARRLVIVSANYNKEQWITYDLSKFRVVGGAVRRWCTNTQGGDRYVEYRDTEIAAGGSSFTSRFAPFTLQTFEVEQVHMNLDTVFV
mmetsp:Transcript_25907/g.54717  ORF Transcript_25907/g.54717 Transcript_25907/m.54717 type:complete len:508 (+) Transcript_25907:49-1572(+)